jgi:hypothetical protein
MKIIETLSSSLSSGEWVVDNNQMPENISVAQRVRSPYIIPYIIIICSLGTK